MGKLGDLFKSIIAPKSGEDVDALARELDWMQRSGSNTATLLQGSEIIKPLLVRDRIESTVFNAASGWRIDGAGNATFRSATITGGDLKITNTADRIHLQADGDAFFGSNIAAPATTALSIFSNAQTYNSESMGAGDVLFGDNSSGKPNLLWDASTGKMFTRSGTIVGGEISGGVFMSYGVRVARISTAQSINTDTVTSVSFDTETYDDAGFYNAGSPTVVTIPTNMGGTYLIGLHAAFAANTTGTRLMFLNINATNYYNPGVFTNATIDGLDTWMSATHERALSAGDAIKMQVQQGSNAALNLTSASMWVRKVR